MPFENKNPWTSGTHFDGPWTPAPWLATKLSKLRAAGHGSVALRCEPAGGGDYACATCGDCADDQILCHVLAAGPLAESERPISTDGSGERVVGSIICWLCARFLDPQAYRVYDEKLLREGSPLAELNDQQAVLWYDPALTQRLAAQGLRLLDAESRTIMIKEPEAA